MSDEHFKPLANITDLAVGKTQLAEIDDKEILICRTQKGYYAVDNLCTHAAARLCDGKLKGNKVLCPLHGAAFDVRDGSALSRPASIPLGRYPVQVEGDNILINLIEKQSEIHGS